MKRRSLLPVSILLTLVAGFASADMYIPFLAEIYGIIGIFSFIPILIVEYIFASFLLKKYLHITLGFQRLLLMVFCANVFSTILGLISSAFIQIGSKGHAQIWWMIIPAFIMTSVFEAPVIYYFVKKRLALPSKKIYIECLHISFLINTPSYILILIIMGIFDNMGKIYFTYIWPYQHF